MDSVTIVWSTGRRFESTSEAFWTYTITLMTTSKTTTKSRHGLERSRWGQGQGDKCRMTRLFLEIWFPGQLGHSGQHRHGRPDGKVTHGHHFCILRPARSRRQPDVWYLRESSKSPRASAVACAHHGMSEENFIQCGKTEGKKVRVS